MNIELQIDRVVLDGLDISAGERHLLLAAFEKELSLLLCKGGIAEGIASHGDIRQITGSPIRMAAAVGYPALGRQIAGSVASSLAGISTPQPVSPLPQNVSE